MSDQIENLKSEDISIGDRPLAIPSELPILPLRDTVLFPNSFMPLAVARESSVRLIDDAIANGKLNEVLDAVESAEADIQEDLEFALVQMKSETLNKITDALTRLEQGTYGNCFECGEEIAEKRLKALPFAVRCKDCEEARENAEQRERQLAQRRGTSGLFMDM